MKCAAAPIDMGSFSCNDRCEEFCKTPMKEKWLFHLSELYPGLTQDERRLASKEPTKMLRAYTLTWEAERTCLKEYSNSRTNDESDACRHFVWAGLIYNALGLEFSTKVLNAHEQDPKQPESEKAMDLANNRLGLLVAEQLIKNRKLTEDILLNAFRDHLQKGDLIVIRKRASK